MDETTLSIIGLLMKALSSRVLLIVAMLMTFGLFCWSMYLGTALSLVVACAFAVLVFLMILLKGDGSHVRKETE